MTLRAHKIMIDSCKFNVFKTKTDKKLAATVYALKSDKFGLC